MRKLTIKQIAEIRKYPGSVNWNYLSRYQKHYPLKEHYKWKHD